MSNPREFFTDGSPSLLYGPGALFDPSEIVGLRAGVHDDPASRAALVARVAERARRRSLEARENRERATADEAVAITAAARGLVCHCSACELSRRLAARPAPPALRCERVDLYGLAGLLVGALSAIAVVGLTWAALAALGVLP